MRRRIFLACLVFVSFGFVSSAVAQDLLPRDNGIYDYHKAPRYRESEAHPLRIVGYALHPFGWLLREGIFRPLSSYAASTRFTRSFFGYREPFDYREPGCLGGAPEVTDCRQIPPLSSIAVVPERAVAPTVAPEDGAGSPAGSTRLSLPAVAFDFNKETLSALGRGRVRQIAEMLAANPGIDITVEGHTDYLGSEDYNQALGERRARTVVKELSELGIDPKRMTAVSYGEARPVFTEEEDWARAVNRRVQLVVGVAGES